MSRVKTIALTEALFAVVFWGASFIATKVALREVTPLTVIWLRFALGVIVLGFFVIARKQFAWIPSRDVPYLVLLGFLGVALHQLLQSNGLVTSQATTTAWIVATTPVFIALLGWLVLKERLSRQRAAGIALAAAGVLLVVTRGDVSEFTPGNLGAPGDVLILLSALNWAVFSVLSRRGLRDYPAARMMFFVLLFGWLIDSALFFSTASPGQVSNLTPTGWAAIAFLGIICSGVCYIFWYDALAALPASQVGVILYIEPLVTMLIAGMILGEAVTIAGLLGGAIILFGVWLVNRPSARDAETDLHGLELAAGEE